MKKQLLFLAPALAALALAITGCTPAPDQTYDKNGIAFSYPANWSISDEEDYGGGSYYMCVEKNGGNSSGLAMISHFDIENSSLEVWFETFIESLEENAQFENIVVEEAVDGTYGNYPAQVVTYTASAMGILPHNGTIWLLETGAKSVAVVFQQADKDVSSNRKGFDLIKSTFTVK